MKRLRKAIFTIGIVSSVALASTAHAACFGTSTNYSCYDDQSGNSYNVQKYGNQTYMNGYNSRTGSSWNQNSQRYGNTSRTFGNDSNGNSWNSYTSPYGSSGTDSNGNVWYGR